MNDWTHEQIIMTLNLSYEHFSFLSICCASDLIFCFSFYNHIENVVELMDIDVWDASSEFGTYRLCEQRRFRRACASALIQAVSQKEPSDRKPDP